MNRMLVIGIGSMIMMDDGLGARVAGAIQDLLQEHDITVLIGETDVQYCLDAIKQDNFLIIIDAMAQGAEPGSVEIIPLQDVIKSHGKLYAQHDYSLIEAVALNYAEIQGYFIGIEPGDIRFGFDLSDSLKIRFDSICERVSNIIFEMQEEADYA